MNERVNVEYKSEYTEDVKKTVIAFLNTSGGKIYIGIDNSGNVIGLNDADQVSLSVISSIRDNVVPDSTMFFKVEKERMNNKDIVVIDVAEGVTKPYYLYQKGMKPSGVFYRVDSATLQASPEHIRRLVAYSDSIKFIEQYSINQELTFDVTRRYFQENNLKFEVEQQLTLGILSKERRYTNLALLLSDQCKHSIKIAVFQDKTKMTFKNRREFTGSIFKQMEEAIDFLANINNVKAEITGLKRKETRDYDPGALREALLNSVIHRDYSFNGSILINVYEDRIEFVNHGGLVKGLNIEELKLGISEPRNEKLANIFYRLEFVEAYGTGIPRIFEYYNDFSIKPTLINSSSVFVITLPNKSYVHKVYSKEESIVEYIKKESNVTRKDVEDKFKIGSTRAFDILKKLEEERVIYSTKIGKKKIYSIE